MLYPDTKLNELSEPAARLVQANGLYINRLFVDEMRDEYEKHIAELGKWLYARGSLMLAAESRINELQGELALSNDKYASLLAIVQAQERYIKSLEAQKEQLEAQP